MSSSRSKFTLVRLALQCAGYQIGPSSFNRSVVNEEVIMSDMGSSVLLSTHLRAFGAIYADLKLSIRNQLIL